MHNFDHRTGQQSASFCSCLSQLHRQCHSSTRSLSAHNIISSPSHTATSLGRPVAPQYSFPFPLCSSVTHVSAKLSTRGCVTSAEGFLQLLGEELMHFRVRRIGQKPQLFYDRISSFLALPLLLFGVLPDIVLSFHSFFLYRCSSFFFASFVSVSPSERNRRLFPRPSSIFNPQMAPPFTLGHSVVC